MSTQQFRWHEDKTKRLWVPVSVTETETARKGSSKTLEDLYKLAPITGSIPKNTFEMTAMEKGFTRRDYRGLLEQALDDSTPDNVRLYQWSIYNPQGLAKASYSRFPQPADQSHRAIRDAKAQERKRKKARKPAKT